MALVHTYAGHSPFLPLTSTFNKLPPFFQPKYFCGKIVTTTFNSLDSPKIAAKKTKTITNTIFSF